jgi:hypothetical protein
MKSICKKMDLVLDFMQRGNGEKRMWKRLNEQKLEKFIYQK